MNKKDPDLQMRRAAQTLVDRIESMLEAYETKYPRKIQGLYLARDGTVQLLTMRGKRRTTRELKLPARLFG